MLNFYILTVFPKAFDSYLDTALLKKAQLKKVIKIKILNLRDFALDKHRKVDDRVYGGGPGMVLKIEPIYLALKKIFQEIKRKERYKKTKLRTKIILFSLRGKKFDQTLAKKLSRYDNLIFICGRYEGVDERVARYLADEEITIGDYILSGGELPALVLIEAIGRHLKGFLGKQESLEEIKGSYPVYTRPGVFVFKDLKKNKTIKAKVPQVLLSGNHKKISEWRKKF